MREQVQGRCTFSATQPAVQMSILLTRSENQILVLETLLKRLVQVCVHTQDKRLAKELKLMDFTRLVRTFARLAAGVTLLTCGSASLAHACSALWWRG